MRAWAASDREALATLANNPKIAANLRDGFPSPYSIEDAERFLARAAVPNNFAIEVDGGAVGGIALMRHGDVERLSAELGYWLGEPFWGRGIMTQVVRAVTDLAFTTLGLIRVYAMPYATTAGSIRVLEKAGFVCEGRLRRSVIKNGQVLDQLMYADVR